jgi:hypothetical protein
MRATFDWLKSHGYMKGSTMTNSGYHDCPCPTCFEIAIGCDEDDNPDLCNECESAGCDGESECSAEPEIEEDELDEGDWVTEDFVTFHTHYQGAGRRPSLHVPEGADWRVVLRERMREEGFFPDVWRRDDHGNIERLTLRDVAPMDDASHLPRK